MKHSADGKRTDRVKKAEREHMVRLRNKGKSVADIAGELERSERTVSKQLAKENALGKQYKLSPFILESRKEHFNYLADIVNELLSNGLDGVTKNPNNREQGDLFEYTIWSRDSGLGIPRQLLHSMLQGNIDRAASKYIDLDLECLISHLKAEYPDIQSKGFRKVVADNPYELIDILRLLVRKKIFKGICPVCKDWQ